MKNTHLKTRRVGCSIVDKKGKVINLIKVPIFNNEFGGIGWILSSIIIVDEKIPRVVQKQKRRI